MIIHKKKLNTIIPWCMQLESWVGKQEKPRTFELLSLYKSLTTFFF